MIRIFAQHAQVGEYHLKTRYIEPGRWEWHAAAPNPRQLPEFSGEETTLEAAKKSACNSIGLAFADWMPIGPGIEFPD
jgi:hypothetical protein